MEDLARVLRDHPFLADLEAENVDFMVGCAANLVFRPGELVLREGERADGLYLVRAGQVALEVDVPRRGRTRVETLEAGDVMGWSWLFDPDHWLADARAVTVVRAFRFDGRCLVDKFETDPRLGFRIAKKLLVAAHRRLERARLQSFDVFAEARS